MNKHIAIVLLSLVGLTLNAIKGPKAESSKKYASHCCNSEHNEIAKKVAHTTGHSESQVHASIVAHEALQNRDRVTLNKLVQAIPNAKARKYAQEAIPGALGGNAQDVVTLHANFFSPEYRMPSWDMPVCD